VGECDTTTCSSAMGAATTAATDDLFRSFISSSDMSDSSVVAAGGGGTANWTALGVLSDAPSPLLLSLVASSCCGEKCRRCVWSDGVHVDVELNVWHRGHTQMHARISARK
jgi:hypothetical protein